MKKISIEEHFTMEEHLDYLTAILEKRYPIYFFEVMDSNTRSELSSQSEES